MNNARHIGPILLETAADPVPAHAAAAATSVHRCAFAQHLRHGIARHHMDQPEHQRHDNPHNRKRQARRRTRKATIESKYSYLAAGGKEPLRGSCGVLKGKIELNDLTLIATLMPKHLGVYIQQVSFTAAAKCQ